MAKAYYGPGSTGAQANLDALFAREGPVGVPTQGLVQAYGGASYSGGRQAYTAGSLPPQGMQMSDGTVAYGTYMGDGTIQGRVRLPDGREVTGRFPLDPLGRSLDPNALAAAGAGTGGGMGGDGDAKLEEQRRLAFGSLAQGANYFAGPLGRQTEQNLSATQAGVDVPYTQAVQDRLFSRQADLNAGQEANQLDAINASFANRGMEGAGAQLAAQLAVGRERAGANTAAESDIANRAQLENFGARERARGASADFLSARSGAEAPYRLKEADMRSRFEVVGQSPFGGMFGGLGAAGNTLAGVSRMGALGAAQPRDMTGFSATPQAPVRYQSSADAMARARQNGGFLQGPAQPQVYGASPQANQGAAGGSFVAQDGGAPRQNVLGQAAPLGGFMANGMPAATYKPINQAAGIGGMFGFGGF